jgi:hypothetical protein
MVGVQSAVVRCCERQRLTATSIAGGKMAICGGRGGVEAICRYPHPWYAGLSRTSLDATLLLGRSNVLAIAQTTPLLAQYTAQNNASTERLRSHNRVRSAACPALTSLAPISASSHDVCRYAMSRSRRPTNAAMTA